MTQPETDRTPIGAVVKTAFRRFGDQAGILIGTSALWLLIVFAASFAIGLVLGVLYAAGVVDDLDAVWITVLNVIVTAVVTGLMLSCFMGGLLMAGRGQPVRLGDFFRPIAVGTYLTIAAISGVVGLVIELVVGIDTTIEAMIVLAAAIVVSLLFTWAYVFPVARGMSGVDSIAASFRLVAARPGFTVLVVLIEFAVLLVGLLLCGIGLIVAFPISMLVLVVAFDAIAPA